ncbi:MAG: hypothetical protein IH820_17345, partial [Bacteroidetes bacterium]|nr:hypothetical protein [Bacteroidota bacterium]
MNTALSLLIVALMGVQSDGKKKEKDPVPEFQGTVKFVVYHEIVTEEELPDGQKSKTKTTVKRVQEALKDLKGLSNLKHIEGTRRFTVEMKGLYSDVDWIRIVLKHAKILSEIISPARIVLQPKGKPRNYAALIRKVKAVPGVGAVGKNRSTSVWGSIVALAESPLREGLLFAGTDDGMIQISEDGGDNWRAIPSIGNDVPDTTFVTDIQPSWHDPNTVYFGGNVLFKTTDQGYSWEEISPDLTTNDKSKQRTSGGEIYQDNTAAEFHCTILTIAESPVEAGVLWVGTDDGNVQITRDGGENWTNVKDNIQGLPDFSWVAKIHASEHDAGTAFVAVDHHRSDDFRPYAFMTTDYGETWTKITNGLPEDDYVKVIRQDPRTPDVLYLGMEHGVYASWDKGANWTSIRNNLPPASVRDLRVQAREGDLIVGTHGRGAWILDDIRPLQELAEARNHDVHLFEARPATRWHLNSRMEAQGQRRYKSPNPEYGAYVTFYLAEKAAEPVTVTIMDEAGQTVRELTDSTAAAGVNRIVWDLRAEGAAPLNAPTGGGFRGGTFRPSVPPGDYTATLKAAEKELQTIITVRPDPRAHVTAAEYTAQAETLLHLRDLVSQVHGLINDTESLTEQLTDLKKKLKQINREVGEAPAAAEEVPLPEAADVLTAIDDALEEIETFRNELKRPPPAMSYRQRPRLRAEIRSLMFAINGATARP